MKKHLRRFGLLLCGQFALLCAAKNTNVAEAGKAPFLLIENKGQLRDEYHRARKDIDFVLKDRAATVFIGNGKIHYQWMMHQNKQADPVASRMDVVLAGARQHNTGRGEEPQAYYEQYFTPAAGTEGIIAHTYKKVVYPEVYPHIDWVVYIRDNQLEYDFVIRPGGKPSDIRIRYEGAEHMKLGADGGLFVRTVAGSVTEHKPIAYALTDRGREAVPAGFALRGNELGFRTGAFKGTLVIDPVLSWGTYYGGSEFDKGVAVATDQQGNVYMTGGTSSSNDIATSGSYQVALGGSAFSSNAFLVKFNSAGVRQWATYYSGNVGANGNSLLCDVDGNVIVAGVTYSDSGIATPGAYQSVYGGAGDAFLAKFSSNGQRLWSTYYGGPGNEPYWQYESRNVLATDPGGNIYLCGNTNSDAGIASAGAHQAARNGSSSTTNTDAFLVKFDAGGQRLWATYYGGVQADAGNGVSCDAMGNVYLAGQTSSDTGIATTGSYQDTLSGQQNGFLVKFNGTGQRQWASYYGTNNYYGTALVPTATSAQTLVNDPWGNIYIAGRTNSRQGIATTGTHKDTCSCTIVPGNNTPGYYYNSGIDAYVAKFNTSGQRVWGTYYGGVYPGGSVTGTESSKLAVNASGEVYLYGTTYVNNGIATAGAYQEQLNEGNVGPAWNDAYLARFDSAGHRQWGTYYGGAAGEDGYGMALAGAANLYICGVTYNSLTGIATPNAHQTVSGGGYDAFLARFNDCELPAANISESGGVVTETPAYTLITFCAGDSTRLAANATPGLQYQWLRNQVAIPGATDSVYHATTSGNYTVVISRNQCTDTARVDSVVVTSLPEPVITLAGTDLTTGSYTTYQWYFNGNPVTGATSATLHPLQNGNYTVEVTNAQGCKGRSVVYVFNGLGIASVSSDWELLQLYPNPNEGHFTLYGKLKQGKEQEIRCQVYDINGVRRYTGQAVRSRKEFSLSLDLRPIAAGAYILQLSTDGQSSYIPFLVR